MQWTETVLLNFGGSVGGEPVARLLLRNQKLYGTVTIGGAFGAGTVFELRLAGKITPTVICDVLTAFPPGDQAGEPQTSLTFGKDGDLYGTTFAYDHQVGGALFRLGYLSE
jgi:uncharacterized repeat protein (TIGR03803 family)